jgi:hypothetical protein
MAQTRGVIPLVAAIIGASLMAWGFISGISAALDGSGNGAGAWVGVFFLGAALVLAALIISIVRLVKGGSKPLAWVTIVVALLPIVGVVVLAIQARG